MSTFAGAFIDPIKVMSVAVGTSGLGAAPVVSSAVCRLFGAFRAWCSVDVPMYAITTLTRVCGDALGSGALPRAGRLALTLWALLLAACAAQREAPAEVSPLVQCRTLVTALDQRVAHHGVGDQQDRRVAGFPYLRVNRMLASYRDELSTAAAYQQWLDELQRLGLAGWAVEYRNLPAPEQQRLWRQARAAQPGTLAFGQAIEQCVVLLREADEHDAQSRSALRHAAVVPDDYSLAKRTLGLYPLTSLAFRQGVSDWHEEVREDYALALAQLPRTGELRVYRPPPARRLAIDEVAAMLQRAAANSLALPTPTAAEQDALFASFAPVYAIDTASRDDRPGAPRWLAGGGLHVDVSAPVVYRYMSHTRFGGQALLQLNYLMWFPARPPDGRPDMLAGTLDGIVWRVTLGASGQPLAFDTIHPCGCYHLVFPGPGVTAREQSSKGNEPVLLPAQAPLPGAADPALVLRVASGTHYLQRVSVASDQHALTGHDPALAQSTPVMRAYRLVPADQLRSLDWRAPQRRSLYGDNALVRGSERLERYLFWPMGIASAGTMRQSGHQATAFIGRRHFDDADLFDALLYVP